MTSNILPWTEVAKRLNRCAIAASDWLAGGCDVHNIPRTQIAALVAITKEACQDTTEKKGNALLSEIARLHDRIKDLETDIEFLSLPYDQQPEYFLQDTRGYVGNCPLWWALNGNGYTTDLRKAHRYTFQDAMRQHRIRTSDLPWSCLEIEAVQRPTVDMQDVHKMRSMSDQIKALEAIASKGGAA